MTSELLPCPWCESTAIIYGRTGTLSNVRCGFCFCAGPPKRTRVEAASAWNTRAPLRPEQPPSDGLADQIEERSASVTVGERDGGDHEQRRIMEAAGAPTPAALSRPHEATVERWPRLTEAMIIAAAEAHYGKNCGNIDGIAMTASDRDWTFRAFMRRIWPAMKRAAAVRTHLETNRG